VKKNIHYIQKTVCRKCGGVNVENMESTINCNRCAYVTVKKLDQRLSQLVTDSYNLLSESTQKRAFVSAQKVSSTLKNIILEDIIREFDNINWDLRTPYTLLLTYLILYGGIMQNSTFYHVCALYDIFITTLRKSNVQKPSYNAIQLFSEQLQLFLLSSQQVTEEFFTSFQSQLAVIVSK